MPFVPGRAFPASHPFFGATGLLAAVGQTPVVPIHHVLPRGISPRVQILAKLESLNPGGSVKDRPALAMILHAIRSGTLHPGLRMLDSSSGNTGVAEAMVGAVLGYPLTLCLPGNANVERHRLLRAYGVEVIETSPLEGSDGAIRKARELALDTGRYCYLNQYDNPVNCLAHQGSTGPEIVLQSGGKVTHFVATLGTSGTFIGTTRYLKSWNRAVRCVAVQPDSPFHGLEGTKHMASSIPPGIYDSALADEDIAAPTEESLALLGRLAREEGLLVGPSSAAALWAAWQVARSLEEGVIVCIFPDGGERYLSDHHLWQEG